MILTPAYTADTKSHVPVACRTPDTCCTCCKKTHTRVDGVGGWDTIGVVLSHTLYLQEVVIDELQAELIFVEGAKEVAGKGVGSAVIHDDVGIVRSQNKELHEKPEGHVALFRRAIWSFLSKASMYQQKAKLEYPGADHSRKIV